MTRHNTNRQTCAAGLLAAALLLLSALCLGAAYPLTPSASAFRSPAISQKVARVPGPVPLDLPAYIAELDRISADLQHAGQNREALYHLRRSLPDHWQVRAGAEHFDVPTTWLASDLDWLGQRKPGAVMVQRTLQHQLADMRAQAFAFASPSRATDAVAARRDLDRILSRREFAVRGPSYLDLLRERIYAWLNKLLGRIFGVKLSKRSGNALAWAAIVLAFLIVLLWVRRTLARRIRAGELDLRGAHRSSWSSRNWIRDALAAADRGAFRQAMFCAYWAAIARLEGDGILSADPARTPRESLLLIPDAHASRLPADLLTQRFELAWYGYRPLSPADWNDVLTQLEKIGCLFPSTRAIAAS